MPSGLESEVFSVTDMFHMEVQQSLDWWTLQLLCFTLIGLFTLNQNYILICLLHCLITFLMLVCILFFFWSPQGDCKWNMYFK